MTSLAEALGVPQSQMAGDLKAGLELLSASETVHFVKYFSYILPLDGFAFWIRADLTPTLGSAVEIDATGALHVSRKKVQDATESYSINRVVFTTSQNLSQDFNSVGPSAIFIGEIRGQKVAFSDQGNFFQQAGLFHYAGDAVYPQMQSQIIDNASAFDAMSPVVSNSLPVWLGMNTYAPPYPGFTIPNGLTLYPSFLVPPNIQPPYGVVHIAEESTEAIGASPFLDQTLSSWQAAKDRVRITLYGCNNDVAVSFLNFVTQYSEDTSAIGLMSIPIIRDAKLKQAELGILAQKKTIDFDVSYQQDTVRAVARQMIARVITGYNPLPYTWQNAV